MINLFQKIQYWLIGEYINSVSDYYEQAKIRLTYNLCVISLLMIAITIYPLFSSKLYVDLFNTLFASIVFLLIPFTLKYRRNVKLASILFVIIIYAALTSSLFFESENIAFSNMPLYALHVAFVFFTLGKRWGIIISITHIIEWLIYCRYFLYDNLHNESAYTPQKIAILALIIFIGIAMLAYTIIQFVNTKIIAENKIKESNIDLQNAIKDLEKAKVIAEQAKVAKEAFLASMSHEIRTPLNAIIGFEQLLKESSLNEEQQEYIESIDFASRNLLVTVNDILDISKIEAGKFEFEEIEFNMQSVIKSVVELVEQKAKEKNIHLLISHDNSIPELLFGDSVRLSQILLNLLGNAVKFTENGTIYISTVLLEENEKEVLCEFSVEDTGIGIPEEKLAIIFERFSQGDINTTRLYGGTGLGLTIVRYLVELQGGKIRVQSKVGLGSEFIFQLSFKKSPTQKANENTTGGKGNSSIIFKKLRILLAEDILLNQRLITKLMEKWGHDLDIAENGKVVIEKVMERNYDIILMDIQMPEMDGYHATEYIRNMEDEAKRNIPIIALTAHASHAEKERCLNLGMNAYLTKPFKQEELFALINGIIQSHSQ